MPNSESLPMTTPTPPTRREHDFLGDKEIPSVAYWGVHSARAVENFPISGNSVAQMPELIRALAFVKKAAARANADLGVIDRKRAGAIILACDDLIPDQCRSLWSWRKHIS